MLHAPKQLAWVTRTCSAVRPAARSFSAEHFAEGPSALPAAADAAADQHFVRGELLDRAVEDVVQHRPALLHVLRENRVDQLPIDPLVLDRHLAGQHHADDRLAAATAGAAGLVQDDVAAARGGDVLAELVEHLVAAGGVFAGGRADLDADPVARRPLPERFLGLLDQRVELLRNVVVHGYFHRLLVRASSVHCSEKRHVGTATGSARIAHRQIGQTRRDTSLGRQVPTCPRDRSRGRLAQRPAPLVKSYPDC